MTSDPERFACVLKAWHDHETELRGYLTLHLSDAALAEDVLQNVFVKAMRQEAKFCALDNSRAWLFAVARNAAIDHRRLTKNLVPLPDALPQEDATPLLGPPVPFVEVATAPRIPVARRTRTDSVAE